MSVPAYSVATQYGKAPDVDGFAVVGVVGANTWHSQLVYQAFDFNGSSVVVTLRNLSGSTVTTTGSAVVLYARKPS